MASIMMKEKFKLVKKYLKEIDPSFQFLSIPIEIKAQSSVKIVYLKPVPTLSFYKGIEREFDSIIEQPFTSNEQLVGLSMQYISQLEQDYEIMKYNKKLRNVQISAHEDLLRVFLQVKNIVQSIERSLTISKKNSLIELLFNEVKQLNALIAESQTILDTIQSLEIKLSIDLEYFIQQNDQITNEKLLIQLDYDNEQEILLEQLELQLTVLKNQYISCVNSKQDDSFISKSAHLALSIKSSLQSTHEYIVSKNCLYHKLCAYIYLEFKRIIYYTSQELIKLEPYVTKINRNISEILYLHFIKKREIQTIHQQQFNIIMSHPYLFLFRFMEQVKEIQIGIKEPLDQKENMEVVNDVRNRSEQLLVELRHCKEVYNLQNSDCFTQFFECKKMKRKNRIKQLKNEVLVFQQTLSFIEEIIKNDSQLKNEFAKAQQFIDDAKQINEQSNKFQTSSASLVISSVRNIRNSIHLNKKQHQDLIQSCKSNYIESESIIVKLKNLEKKFAKYFDVSQFKAFSHLFENTFFQLNSTLEQLYITQEQLVNIIQSQSFQQQLLSQDISNDTHILLQDINNFILQFNTDNIRETDNRKLLDQAASNILKLLMRIKKREAQIQYNLDGQDMIISIQLRQELTKMNSSLSIHLTNLECLGIILESRHFFNSECIVSAMYELLNSAINQNVSMSCLEEILKCIPDHSTDISQFISQYYSKVSENMKNLIKVKLEVELYIYDNFLQIKNGIKDIKDSYEIYSKGNKQYKGKLALFDSDYLNVLSHIVNSNKAISNIVIDMQTNHVLSSELQFKLSNSLKQLIQQLNEYYVSAQLQQCQKIAYSVLNYTNISENIINSLITTFKVTISNTPSSTTSRTMSKQNESSTPITQSINNIKLKTMEYFSLVKEIKSVKLLMKVKVDPLIITNISQYEKLLDSIEPTENLIQELFDSMQSIEGILTDYESNVRRISPNTTDRRTQYQEEMIKEVNIITSQFQSKFRHDYNSNIKYLANSFTPYMNKLLHQHYQNGGSSV